MIVADQSQDGQKLCSELVCNGELGAHEAGEVHHEQHVLHVVFEELVKLLRADVWDGRDCVGQVAANLAVGLLAAGLEKGGAKQQEKVSESLT